MDLPADRTGVLPCQYLERAIEARVIEAGGVLRMIWRNGDARIIDVDGNEMKVDGRAYQGFLTCVLTETGNTDDKDLVMEWRKP